MFPPYPRPADPTTGLPVQAFTSASFRLWLSAVLGTIVLTQLLLLWAMGTFPDVEPPPPLQASAAGGPSEQAEPAPPKLTRHDGRRLYKLTCTACHGPTAKGVPNLGKDLTLANPFMREQSEDALVQLIINGRAADDPANTTKIAMPPNGGNPDLTSDEVRAIVLFLKSLKS